jgi:pimeloyl-ACP methyl ester carboxylesterase
MFLGDLAARTTGDGPPVVLLHGNGESMAVFDAMVPFLDGFTLIGLDARGHGATPAGDRPLTIAHLGVDVAHALDEYRTHTGYRGSFGVIGFSDGANVSLEVAIHRPDLIGAQVLIGGNRAPGAMKLPIYVGILAGYAALSLAGLVSPAARRTARVWSLMLTGPHHTDADLRRATAPTLVVAAQRDVVSSAESLHTARVLPDARWVEIPGQGHLLPVKAPRVTGELSAEFLRVALHPEYAGDKDSSAKENTA